MIDQVCPFQCSTSVVQPWNMEKPTAKQLVVLRQDTPSRKLLGVPEPLGFGLVMIDQVCPFQCSTNVEKALGAWPDWVLPTAKQLVVLGQDTPLR